MSSGLLLPVLGWSSSMENLLGLTQEKAVRWIHIASRISRCLQGQAEQESVNALLPSNKFRKALCKQRVSSPEDRSGRAVRPSVGKVRLAQNTQPQYRERRRRRSSRAQITQVTQV